MKESTIMATTVADTATDLSQPTKSAMPSLTSALSSSGSSHQKPLRLRRVNHSDEVSTGFAKLLKSESMTDVTLICQGGQTMRAHRVILATFSPYFKGIFEAQPFNQNPCQYPVIVMKDLSLMELKTIIEFIYKGEVSVPRERLSSILQAARALEVSGLSDLKVENFGISSGSPTSTSSTFDPTSIGSSIPSPKPSSTSSLLGTNFSGISAPLTGVGALSFQGNAKRSQDMDQNMFSGNNSDQQLKKLRITLDGDIPRINNIGSSGQSAVAGNIFINDLGSPGVGSSFLDSNNLGSFSGFGSQGEGVDPSSASSIGIKSLLQQPPRFPQALQQIRQQQQQQQQQLQQLQQLQMQKQRQMTLQQFMQQRQLQQQRQQRQMQMQQQHQLKQQILQTQLMSQKNSQPKQFSMFKGSQSVQFMQFQQRIKQQLQDKQHNQISSVTSSNSSRVVSTLQERLLQKPMSQRQSSPNDNKIKSDQSTNSPESSVTNNGKEDTNGNDGNQSDDEKNSVEESICNESTEKNEEGDEEIEVQETHKTSLETALARPVIDKDDKANSENIEDHNGNTNEGDSGINPTDGSSPTSSRPASRSPSLSGSSEQRVIDLTENSAGLKEAYMSYLKSEGKAATINNNGNKENSENNIENDGAEEGVEYLDEEVHVANQLTGDTGDEDEEYEVEIGKDLIFQRQQQLRLQQLQKQQQFQQQVHLQLQQDEQEQKLLEFHQHLQQAAATGGTAPVEENSLDDNTNEFGFNWQEGFTDGPFIAIEGTESSSEDRGLVINDGNSLVPDFLQPRGPGRPRKGNKSQEISPCPECNKVFVRPDVLKLHYRSVHLNERHPCSLCPKIFKWPGDLSKHKRTKHPDATM